jgi:hypothetical protein
MNSPLFRKNIGTEKRLLRKEDTTTFLAFAISSLGLSKSATRSLMLSSTVWLWVLGLGLRA